MTDGRRFPPPWAVEPIPGGYRVLDAASVRLVYVYGQPVAYQTSRAFSLTVEQAMAVANAIAALPSLIGGQSLAGAVSVPGSAALPWTARQKDGRFEVEAANELRVATVYYQDPRAGDLTPDQARRIAANIARLPALTARQPRAGE